MRSKESNGVVTVKALIKHPMETGQRKDKKTGDLIPAHYIQEVHSKANGKDVITIYWGPAVSKNPYLTFKYKGSKCRIYFGRFYSIIRYSSYTKD